MRRCVCVCVCELNFYHRQNEIIQSISLLTSRFRHPVSISTHFPLPQFASAGTPACLSDCEHSGKQTTHKRKLVVPEGNENRR